MKLILLAILCALFAQYCRDEAQRIGSPWPGFLQLVWLIAAAGLAVAGVVT